MNVPYREQHLERELIEEPASLLGEPPAQRIAGHAGVRQDQPGELEDLRFISRLGAAGFYRSARRFHT